MRTRITVLMIVLALAICLAVSQTAIASDEDDVLQVAQNFAKAFNTSDFELMSSTHWHSPQLSAFSGSFLTQGWNVIGKSFKSTFDLCPSGTFVMSIHNPQVTMLSDSVAITTFYQNLTVNPPATPEQITEQNRKTLVLKKIDDRWLIVHEHYSNFPTE